MVMLFLNEYDSCDYSCCYDADHGEFQGCKEDLSYDACCLSDVGNIHDGSFKNSEIKESAAHVFLT
jgi:hypothetical protein